MQGLTRPVVGGIALDEALTVQWPTGLHALMAFLHPDVLVERAIESLRVGGRMVGIISHIEELSLRLMTEIDRIANTPCPLAEREQRIAIIEKCRACLSKSFLASRMACPSLPSGTVSRN